MMNVMNFNAIATTDISKPTNLFLTWQSFWYHLVNVVEIPPESVANCVGLVDEFTLITDTASLQLSQIFPFICFSVGLLSELCM